MTLSSSPRIGIIDYGSGNLKSVVRAFEACGHSLAAELQAPLTCIVKEPQQLTQCDALVMPGVGAFGDAVHQLHAQQLWTPLWEWIQEGRPYFGICLGYQILFESSEESPGVQGLGIFQGRVRRFSHTSRAVISAKSFPSSVSSPLKVPHMGWNSVQVQPHLAWMYQGLKSDVDFYFVHSFYPEPSDPALTSALCSYGCAFAASIASGKLAATQFHPEKSQQSGLQVLRNFIQHAC